MDDTQVVHCECYIQPVDSKQDFEYWLKKLAQDLNVLDVRKYRKTMSIYFVVDDAWDIVHNHFVVVDRIENMVIVVENSVVC